MGGEGGGGYLDLQSESSTSPQDPGRKRECATWEIVSLSECTCVSTIDESFPE
jgi:hypothetical protein